MSNALTLYSPLSASVPTTLEDKLTYADHFAAAGLFTDVRGASQCLVKIQAGAELGFPPYASMNGISIIQGKPAIGGGMYNALIDASPDHDLEVLEMSETRATGRFWSKSKRTGQWVLKGEFSFSMEDAAKLKLSDKDNYKRQPRNMLFWRMVSNGARMYFPALCAGLYTPDELGEEVDTDTGERLRKPAPLTQSAPEPIVVEPVVKADAAPKAQQTTPPRPAQNHRANGQSAAIAQQETETEKEVGKADTLFADLDALTAAIGYDGPIKPIVALVLGGEPEKWNRKCYVDALKKPVAEWQLAKEVLDAEKRLADMAREATADANTEAALTEPEALDEGDPFAAEEAAEKAGAHNMDAFQ